MLIGRQLGGSAGLDALGDRVLHFASLLAAALSGQERGVLVDRLRLRERRSDIVFCISGLGGEARTGVERFELRSEVTDLTDLGVTDLERAS